MDKQRHSLPSSDDGLEEQKKKVEILPDSEGGSRRNVGWYKHMRLMVAGVKSSVAKQTQKLETRLLEGNNPQAHA